MTLDGISDLFDRIESEWQRRLPRSRYPTSCWQDYRAHLEQHGYVADTRIGLAVLKDCRAAALDAQAVAQMLDRTLRHFGYEGGGLRVRDFRDERTGRATFLFFDEARFAEPADAVESYLQDSTLRAPWRTDAAA